MWVDVRLFRNGLKWNRGRGEGCKKAEGMGGTGESYTGKTPARLKLAIDFTNGFVLANIETILHGNQHGEHLNNLSQKKKTKSGRDLNSTARSSLSIHIDVFRCGLHATLSVRCERDGKKMWKRDGEIA